MHENRFNEYRIPSGMLIVFLEKALTLIHMETHLDDVSQGELALYGVRCPHLLPAATLSPAQEGNGSKCLVIERDLSERFLNWWHAPNLTNKVA